ncbi:hypothetical protein LTR36_008417 [Oleoguttula mirabilis]|uniref:Uncharacterized protein n=1 Tax=Oleoguttula mirabilis TaxID=1507867 RepID=A0AAV9J8K0_9PEZI|nr:hypothetical protein LTR36_008417 [Oleoguttula mirabilis]
MATHRHLDHDDCYTFSTLVKGFTEDSGPDHFRPFFAKFYALFNHGGYEYSVRVNYRGTGSTFTTHPAADSTPVDLSCRSASGSEAPEKDAGRGGTLQADELVNGPQKESSADKNMSNIVSQADEPTQGAQNAIDVAQHRLSASASDGPFGLRITFDDVRSFKVRWLEFTADTLYPEGEEDEENEEDEGDEGLRGGRWGIMEPKRIITR